jgi:hypothetical protein
LFRKSRKEPIGLDQDFKELHRLFRFTPDNVARLRVLSVYVFKNDLAMVRKVRALWPEMSCIMVVTHDRYFFERAFWKSGREVLAELMDWWGVEHIKEIFSRSQSLREINFHQLHFYDFDVDHITDSIYNTRSKPNDLEAVLEFLMVMSVPLINVLKKNSDLLLHVVSQKPDSKAAATLRILRRWGMTVADVRIFSKKPLWPALSTAPEALGELATWGLGKADAAYDDYVVLRLAAKAGNVRVLEVLARNYNLTAVHAQKYGNAALRSAARHGHVDVLNLLYDVYGLRYMDAQANDNEALRTAATFGHVRVLEILRNKFGLSRQDAQAKDNAALREAAAQGHSGVLNVLRDMYTLTRDDARMFNNEALRAAAENGHAEVLRVLQEKFGLKAKDAQDQKYEALRMAAKNGHAGVLKVLSEEFRLEVKDAPEESNQALCSAAEKGHVEVLNVLHAHFGLTGVHARAKNNQALIRAAWQGKAQVLQVLRNVYNLNADDARDSDNVALVGAASRGFSDVLKVLRNDYQLTADDARARDNAALREAAMHGHVGVLQVLARDFQLTAEDARANENEAMKNGSLEIQLALAREFKLNAKDTGGASNRYLRQALMEGDLEILKIQHELGLGREDVLPQLRDFFIEAERFKDAKAAALLRCLWEDYGLLRADLDFTLLDLSKLVDLKSLLISWIRSSTNVSKALKELVEGWGLGVGDDAAGRAVLKQVVGRGENVKSRKIREYLDEKLGKGWDK